MRQVVEEAHAMYKDLKDGKNADYIPILATPEDMYGKVMSVPDKAMPIYHKFHAFLIY